MNHYRYKSNSVHAAVNENKRLDNLKLNDAFQNSISQNYSKNIVSTFEKNKFDNYV